MIIVAMLVKEIPFTHKSYAFVVALWLSKILHTLPSWNSSYLNMEINWDTYITRFHMHVCHEEKGRLFEINLLNFKDGCEGN